MPKNQVQVASYYNVSGKQVIDDEVISETFGYFGLYFIIYFFGTVIIALNSNVNFGHAMFEFASCLSTVGLSAGVTTPDTPALTLIVEIIGMFLGRLEIYIALVGFHLTFQNWRQKLAAH